MPSQNVPKKHYAWELVHISLLYYYDFRMRFQSYSANVFVYEGLTVSKVFAREVVALKKLRGSDFSCYRRVSEGRQLQFSSGYVGVDLEM